MSNIEIKTERLSIIPRTVGEMEEIIARESDAEMHQAYTEMLETMLRLPGREEWGCEWRIRIADGRTIGGICFKGVADAHGVVEIGYGIDEAWQRQGYATEAVGGVARWALEQPDVRWVTAQTEPDNAISQRVLKNNGFVRDGDGDEGPMFRLGRSDIAQ